MRHWICLPSFWKSYGNQLCFVVACRSWIPNKEHEARDWKRNGKKGETGWQIFVAGIDGNDALVYLQWQTKVSQIWQGAEDQLFFSNDSLSRGGLRHPLCSWNSKSDALLDSILSHYSQTLNLLLIPATLLKRNLFHAFHIETLNGSHRLLMK